MNIYSIYKATNKINGKVYIGFDSNWPHRKNSHKCYHVDGKTKFHRAIKKYGWENFEWELIYQSKDRNFTLGVMERHFIEEYDTFKKGYNSTLGGEGTFGKKQSERNKKLLSESRKGQGNPNYGKPMSEEQKKKISIALKGMVYTEERRKNISLSKKGKKLSEETKKKMSDAKKRNHL